MEADLANRARRLFDETAERLSGMDVHYAVKDLIRGLHTLREESGPRRWKAYLADPGDKHPLAGLLHQDPLTRRSYEQPRGYAGDAELLDLIYGIGELPGDMSCLGAVIYAATFQSACSRAARQRLSMLANALDEVAIRVRQANVLSVACGHLREAQRSKAMAQGRFAEFFALDQDPVSLDVVKQEQAGNGVTAVHGSVKSILAGETTFADLDLVYATGLYDYLREPVAVRLTKALFGFLRPGGRLLVANFRTGLTEDGYMERFMSWPLVYRTDQEMFQLSRNLPAEHVRIFHDREARLVFLELTKE